MTNSDYQHFHHLRKVQSMGARFLRKYATVTLLADVLGPRGWGATVYAGWLLNKDMQVGLDGRLVKAVCSSLHHAERVALVHMPQLAYLRPDVFLDVIGQIQRSLLACASKVDRRAVEALAYMIYLFAVRHPRSIKRINSLCFDRMVGSINETAAPGVYTTTVQLFLGNRLDRSVRRFIELSKNSEHLDVLSDVLGIHFAGRRMVVRTLQGTTNGRDAIARVSARRRQWAELAANKGDEGTSRISRPRRGGKTGGKMG